MRFHAVQRSLIGGRNSLRVPAGSCLVAVRCRGPLALRASIGIGFNGIGRPGCKLFVAAVPTSNEQCRS